MLNGPRTIAALAAFAVLMFVGAGCSSNGSSEETAADEGPATTQMSEESMPTSDTAAAKLRSDLTYLLGEHVELAGISVVEGVENGLDSPQFNAATGALDQNSQDLAAAIESVYGPEAGTEFLALWRAHINMFANYAEGRATGNQQQVQKAMQNLRGYRQDFGAFLDSANPNLTQDAVMQALAPHVETLTAAIDSVAAGSPEAYGDLQRAADEMPAIAAVLAGAFAEQMPDQFGGDADSAASTLRADLTHLLNQHVYAATIAVDAGLTAGLDSPQFDAASAALDQNTQKLAAAIGSVYGEEAESQFLSLWRAHINMFVNYAEGRATGNQQQVQKAMQNLGQYRRDFGAFMASANPNLTQEAIAEQLVPHVESLTTVIDSAAAGDLQVYEQLRTAAAHMPGTAAILAEAIAEQNPGGQLSG